MCDTVFCHIAALFILSQGPVLTRKNFAFILNDKDKFNIVSLNNIVLIFQLRHVESCYAARYIKVGSSSGDRYRRVRLFVHQLVGYSIM